MINFLHLTPLLRRRWPAITLAGTLVGAGVLGGLRLQRLVGEQLPGILDASLESALGREVDLGPISLSPLGAQVAGLTVHRIQGESRDPLTAKRLDVELDWWRLLTRRELQVRRVEADGAQVRLTSKPGEQGKEAWTSQVLALSKSGVQRFALRNASIELAPATGPATWTTAGVTGELVLGSRQFHYDAKVKRFASAEVELTGLNAAGSGDAQGLTLTGGTGTYQGGKIHAAGSVKTAGNEALLTLQVEKLPLGRLATRMGIPAEWAMQGTVTGQMTVDARDNSLRSVRGTVDVAHGSLTRPGGELPWQSAHAVLDWTPAAIRLSDVRILGKDLLLSAAGDVTLPAGKPFTEGAFQITGKVEANRAAAVAQVADLLAFRQLLGGRWSAGRSTVEFQAQGKVGSLDQASAHGRLHVEEFTFRPVAGSEPVMVQRLDADLQRDAERLQLRNVRATTDGLTVAAAATMTNGHPGGPAEFLASGSVDVRDLKSLRKAVPQASLWKWVPVVSASANGRLDFRIGGPVGDMEQLWSDGTFEVRDFRLSAHSPLPNDSYFFVPVKVARAGFRHAHRRLEVQDLQIESRTFRTDGGLTIDFTAPEPQLTTDLQVRTDDWRGLPAMPPGTLPELSGGKFTAQVHAAGTLGQLARSEISGDFLLDGPTYTPAVEPARPVALDQVSARFRWAGGATARERVLELPEIKVTSSLVTATAAGQATPEESGYRLQLKVQAQAPNVGELTGRFTDAIALSGGAAKAELSLDAPVKRLAEGTIEGNLQVTDATVKQPVALLGLTQIDAQRFAATFTGKDGAWRISSATLTAPGLEASLTGTLESSAMDAQLALTSKTWSAPETLARSLPLAGGTIALSGRMHRGSSTEPFAFDGEVRLADAAARFESKSASVTGGALTAVLHGAGSFGKPLEWVRSGELKLTGGRLAAGKLSPRPLAATADFVREGEAFRLTNGSAAAGGAQGTFTGEWTPQGHRLDLNARTKDLAGLGLTLPAGTRVGAVRLVGTATGTSEKPLERLQATVEAHDLQAKHGELPAQRLEQVTGRLDWNGERLQLTDFRGQGPAGTVTAAGEWTRTAHHVALTAAGEQLERLGLALPETLHIQGFAVTAELSGTAKAPLSAGTGTVDLTNGWFRLGRSGPQHLDRASSRFQLQGSKLTLSGLTATGSAGDFTGSGSVAGRRFQVRLASARVNPDLVRWTVPGQMSGGALAGNLVIDGTGSIVESATGRFQFTNGHYLAPVTLNLVDRALLISGLAADYRWQSGGEGGKTTLSNVQLQTSLGTGTGTLVAQNGAGRVTAELASTNAGGIADRWPAITGRLIGGAGTGKLDLRFDLAGVRGTLAFTGKGGTVHLPGETAEYADHPVDRLSGTLGFEPGKLTFTDMQLRGPKANLDGSGTWQDGGAVAGTGKAWFSKAYTSRLIKPSGFGWLAKLFGLREIKSNFQLSGTSDAVKLNASITRGLVWKVAKGQVPKEFQQIATGKSPLWVKPAVVAEAPTAAPTAAPTRAGGE